ncbi:MAG TPA: hypothetical protein VGV35_11500 [Bryobacteraceae bacterium]|nr:hypothetical protein [Bryobacteraceae bacterium]
MLPCVSIDSASQILSVAPAVWPGPPLPLQPGDPSHFVPAGLGLGTSPIIRPWDRLEDVAHRPDYYGFNAPSSDPFQNAPLYDACGGIIYFDGRPKRNHLDTVLALLEVSSETTEYAAFHALSANPLEQRYLEQLRFVAPHALISLFGVQPQEDTQPLVKQKLTIAGALWRFIELQQEKYNRTSRLNGVMGGDGDWAKESLAFGFMVENSYHGIYRIWSRAWLVTK